MHSTTPVADKPQRERCAHCGNLFTAEELDDPSLTYKEVVSWATGPKLQSPVLREKTGRRSHYLCIYNLINGNAADQPVIPGMEEE